MIETTKYICRKHDKPCEIPGRDHIQDFSLSDSGKCKLFDSDIQEKVANMVCLVVLENPSKIIPKDKDTNDDALKRFREHINYIDNVEGKKKKERQEKIVIWNACGDREWAKSKNRFIFKYLDSSIWQYFYDEGAVDNNGNDNVYGCPNQEQIANEVSRRAKVLGKGGLCRYDLWIAEEYRELNQRKWENSFLKGPHGGGVYPFVHHSEYAIWKQLEKNLDKAKTPLGGGYEWKILLVDDHAESGLAIVDKDEVTTFGKKTIIEDDLQCINEGYGHSRTEDSVILYDKDKIVIECVTTIDEALGLLRAGDRYDIVLLDYKLDIKKDNTVVGCVFGTDILTELETTMRISKDEYCPSPAGEYNFLFISAYPTAVQEDMLSRGLYSQTDYWFVRRGACPTNTPWLFLYELHRMMERRLKKLTSHIGLIKKYEEKPSQPTALGFINWLFVNSMQARDKCKNSFNAFLSLRSTYDKIKYDVYDGKDHLKENKEWDNRYVNDEKQESKLIRSMFPDVVCYSNTFWEHMQHLVYLTAYGTNRQWSEMWEEFMCVSKTIEVAEKEIGKSTGEEEGVVSLIRKYILGLKNGKY